jgi:hypothetical protein
MLNLNKCTYLISLIIVMKLLINCTCNFRIKMCPKITIYLAQTLSTPIVLCMLKVMMSPVSILKRLIQVNNAITNNLHLVSIARIVVWMLKSDIFWPLKHGSSESEVDWQK